MCKVNKLSQTKATTLQDTSVSAKYHIQIQPFVGAVNCSHDSLNAYKWQSLIISVCPRGGLLAVLGKSHLAVDSTGYTRSLDCVSTIVVSLVEY